MTRFEKINTELTLEEYVKENVDNNFDCKDCPLDKCEAGCEPYVDCAPCFTNYLNEEVVE